MRSSTTYLNRRLSAGTSTTRTVELADLHAEIEAEQRRDEMVAGELQLLAQRE